MRTLSSALTAQQIAAAPTPYVKFKLTSADGNTTYDYTSRVLMIEHHEEAYADYATVVLQNNDRGVETSLNGYWVQIAYGYITGNAVADVEGAESAGNNDTAEYSYTPRLWVKRQQEYSAPGQVKTILWLEGAWHHLSELQRYTGDPPLFETSYSTDTIYDIISALLVEAGYTLDALDDQDDGIIDTFAPAFKINQSDIFEEFADYSYLIRRLIVMTKCYLRAKTGLAFKVIYPQEGDAVKETYKSDAQYWFKEYLEVKKALLPNHIIVIWGDNGDGTWDCVAGTVGSALDQDEIDAYRDIPQIVLAGELTSEADSDDRASVILTRKKGEMMSGHLVIRHDCSVELYDRVAVQDNR